MRGGLVLLAALAALAGLGAAVPPPGVDLARAEVVDIRPADVVTSRALAALETLLPLAHRFLKPHGTCLFLK